MIPTTPPNPQAGIFYETLAEQINLHLGNSSYPVFKQTAIDWYFNRRIWREISEEMYHDQLNIVPPRRMNAGSFVGGECACHTNRGASVYSAFRERHGRFATMYMTLAEYDSRALHSEAIVPVPDPLEIE